MAPSVTNPASIRPSASAPGEYAAPALRIETNADAHSTTVTQAATAASASARGAGREDGGEVIMLQRLGRKGGESSRFSDVWLYVGSAQRRRLDAEELG